jgi:KaiC/GvpD/RAD55 family RecA-like ATPase
MIPYTFLNEFKMLSKKDYYESRRLKPNDLVLLNHAGQKGHNKAFETNALIRKIDPLETLAVEKEPQKMDNQVDLIPQVSVDELKPPDKVENSTAIMKQEQPVIYDDAEKDYFTFGDLLRLNIKNIPFLVEKLLPAGVISILGGESQSGKSLLSQQLAIAIIHGDETFLGFKLNPEHKRVLIVNTEDNEFALSSNILKLTTFRKQDPSMEDRLIVFTHSSKLLERIEDIMNKYKFDLVVLDPLSDILLGDMNVSNITRQYLTKFQMLAKKHNCATLFVHHTGKAKDMNQPNKAQLLGSVGIEGKARQVLMMSVDKNDLNMKIISIVKGNYLSETDKSKKVYAKLDPQTLVCKECEYVKPIQSAQSAISSSGGSRSESKPGRKRDSKLWAQAVKLYKEGKKQCDIAREVGVCAATISRWIDKYKKCTVYDTSKVGDVD